jgi:transposase
VKRTSFHLNTLTPGAGRRGFKRLPKVATEMALHVLAYNITRVMNIMGIEPLIAAMRV